MQTRFVIFSFFGWCSCAAVVSTTTPAGLLVCITPPTAFLQAAALTPLTAVLMTSAMQPWPQIKSTTRWVSLLFLHICWKRQFHLFKRVYSPCTNGYLQILSHMHILPLICTYNMSTNPPPTNLLPAFQGCFELVTSFMETNMAIIAGVTFGIAFSQVSMKKGEANIRRFNRYGFVTSLLSFSWSACCSPAVCPGSSQPTSMRWSSWWDVAGQRWKFVDKQTWK